MAVEIERKFLVRSDGWRAHATRAISMRQGYFDTAGSVTVRVRRADERAVLTIKGPALGLARAEYEYEIPAGEADAMLDSFCRGRQVEKTRHIVEFSGKIWEVDVFGGAHQGLVLAEVELERPDEPVTLPEWVGEEVSHDPRYRNAHLARHPAKGV